MADFVDDRLSNAFKYTRKGKVGVSVRHDLTMSYVRVSDSGMSLFLSWIWSLRTERVLGVGIPKDHIDHVFERFFRVNNNVRLLGMVY
jgi:signal transduction histidine kinase